jgi:hypothetical protein
LFGLIDSCTGSFLVLSGVEFLCVSAFCLFYYRQNNAIILFCVYKKFGAFLCSLLCFMLSPSDEFSYLCLCYICVCSEREMYYISLFVINIIINLFVILLILGSHLTIFARFSPPALLHIPY